MSFPKTRGCSGASASLRATAGPGWCRLFRRNIFRLQLAAVCCHRVCFYVPGNTSVCARSNFLLKKTSPGYLGGSAPPWRAHTRAHCPVCRRDWDHRWTWATAGPTASSLPRDTGDRSSLRVGEGRGCPERRQRDRWGFVARHARDKDDRYTIRMRLIHIGKTRFLFGNGIFFFEKGHLRSTQSQKQQSN